MAETDDEVVDADGDSTENEDTSLLVAGTLLGLGIGIFFAIVTGDTRLGLSIGIALGVVIPSGIRGSDRW